jgi:hypothetical protein
MAFNPVQLYGETTFAITPPKLVQRARQIDRIDQKWQVPREDYYAPEDAFPGYEHMRIIEVEPDTEIPDAAYEVMLRGEGIANGDTWKELDRQNNSPDTGWDEIDLEIYTRDLAAGRWEKGERMQADALTGIAATASTDTLTKVAHGLVTGQLLQDFTFGSGFAGLTSGNDYFVIKITADTFKLATTRANAEAGTAIDITTDGTGASATPIVFGHELMFITGRRDRPADAKDYHHLDLELKGLLMRNGDSKPVMRQWDTSSAGAQSKWAGIAILSTNRYEGFPPVDDGVGISLSGPDLNVEYALPSIRVTDTIVSTTEPDASWLYAAWEPDDAPALTLYSLAAEAYIYRFPYGWRLTAMQVQQLPGKSVWLLQLTWEKFATQIPTTLTDTDA